MVLALQADAGEGGVDEIADRVGDARPDHVVARLVGLEHLPHRLDVLLRVAPVAADVEVAEHQLVGTPQLDGRHALTDPAGDERRSAPRRLVVEEDPRAGVETEALAVVDGDEVSVDLGDPVGASRVERGLLALRHLAGAAEHLRGGGLVVASLRADLADPLQQPCHAHGGVLGGGDRQPPGLGDRRHRRQVVDLVGLAVPQDVDERALVDEVPGVKGDPVRDRLEALEGPVGGAADQAVHLVALIQQELREVAAVLPRDPRDQGAAHGSSSSA